MAGIIVGIDGSHHSERALKWAVNEAVLRQTPLTVLSVRQVIRGWAGPDAGPYPGTPNWSSGPGRRPRRRRTRCSPRSAASGLR